MLLWVLFGQSGAGKNYVARLAARELGFEICDGDDHLTAPMREALARGQGFTQSMRDDFTEVLVRRVLAQSASPRLALVQALFKEQNRARLLQALPDARFIWVRASPSTIARRLARRADHAASEHYALAINAGFERPRHAHLVLDNDMDGADDAIVGHLRESPDLRGMSETS